MSEPIDVTCAATQRCSHQPSPGLLVCRGHLERLGAMLRDIEDEAALLSAVPSMQQNNGRGGSLASHRSPARLDVLVANDHRQGRPPKDAERYDPWAFDDTASVVATLHGWARIVRDERSITEPEQIAVTTERNLLTRHLDWIAAQPWIDEFHTDLTELIGQLKNSNGHRAERPYSRCPAIVGGDYCTGDVWVRDELQPVWRIYTDRCAQQWEQAPGSAVCDTCGSSWTTPGEKARLDRMVKDATAELVRPRTEDGRPMFTAEELVAQGKVSSVHNVRVIAHRNGQRSVDGYYDPDWFAKLSA